MRRTISLLGVAMLTILTHTMAIADTADASSTNDAITITSDDVAVSGLATAYTTHSFAIEKGSHDVRNPVWSLCMPLSDGETETIYLEDDNLSCHTEPIDDYTKYMINDNGCITATLNFSCTIGGKKEEAAPFLLALELKPFIEYAKIVKIVDNAPYDSYDAHFCVKYFGAESITYFVEEEHSTVLIANTIFEPYLAYGVADHITASDYAWIDFTAENDYGTATYTIELQPYGKTDQDTHVEIIPSDGYGNGENPDAADCYEAFDTQGRFLGRYTSLESLKAYPFKGILIIKACRNGNTTTFKLNR